MLREAARVAKAMVIKIVVPVTGVDASDPRKMAR
jgi:hypothetical protein